jgi:predicted ATP-dependent serine protease
MGGSEQLPDIFLDLKEELNRDVVAECFSLKVYSKTITLIGGQSLTGKTVCCLHFSDDCVKKGKVVLYFDTDSHPVCNRPDPNLLTMFSSREPDKYQKFFHYTRTFNTDDFIKYLDMYSPSLVIIDSIYAPFMEAYQSSPKLRAKSIKHFLMEVRNILYQKNIAMIVTSQVGKETSVDGDSVVYNILGGEGLKHMSDTKWVIDFASGSNDKTSNNKMGKRVMFIDKQASVEVEIGYGGVIDKVK